MLQRSKSWHWLRHPTHFLLTTLLGRWRCWSCWSWQQGLGKALLLAKSFRRMHWEWHWMLVHPVHFPLSLPAGRFGFSVGSENSPNCGVFPRGGGFTTSPFGGFQVNACFSVKTPNLWSLCKEAQGYVPPALNKSDGGHNCWTLRLDNGIPVCGRNWLLVVINNALFQVSNFCPKTTTIVQNFRSKI